MSHQGNVADHVLTPGLCREARSLLDMELAELAFVSRLPLTAVQLYESGDAPLPAPAQASLRRILERGGIEFAPGLERRGVRLKGG